MSKLIDAHCHIGCVPTGCAVSGFVFNAITTDDWNQIITTANQNPNIYAAIGIHPWYVQTAPTDWNVRLYKLLADNPRLMIGETGLDKLRPDYELQCAIFMRHVEMANQLRRPLHIHCVRAWNDVFSALRDAPDIPSVLLHGFAGAPETVAQFAKFKNVYFGFGRAILDARRTKLQNALRVVPKNRILIESDVVPAQSEYILTRVAAQITKNIAICPTQIYNNTMEFLNK